MSDKPLKQLAVDWEHGTDFLECFEEGSPRRIRTELDVPDWPDIGELCTLLLRFKDRQTEFQIHGVFLERQKQVAIFELLAEERMRHELVLVGARGESLPYRRRRHTRIPCRFVVSVLTQAGGRVPARTTTFGAGGVHLSLEEPIAVDEQLTMTITLSDGKKLELVGRVTGRIDEGPERGSSVEFLFRSAAQRDEVAAIAAGLEASARPA